MSEIGRYLNTKDGTDPAQVTRLGKGLVLEERQAEWSSPSGIWQGRRGSCFRLIDEAAAAVVLDTSAILTCDWLFPPDGRILLRIVTEIGDRRREEILAIDPATATYRDLSDGDGPRPLSALQDAAEEAFRRARMNEVCDPSLPRGGMNLHRIFSPDGSFRCEVVEWEVAHSWGCVPRVYLTTNNELVLDLGDLEAPARFSFPDGATVRIVLPGAPEQALLIWPNDHVGEVEGEGERLPLPLLQDRLGDWITRDQPVVAGPLLRETAGPTAPVGRVPQPPAPAGQGWPAGWFLLSAFFLLIALIPGYFLYREFSLRWDLRNRGVVVTPSAYLDEHCGQGAKQNHPSCTATVRYRVRGRSGPEYEARVFFEYPPHCCGSPPMIYDPEEPARVLPVQEVGSPPSDGYFVATAFPGVLALLFAFVGLISWSDRRKARRQQQP